MAGEQVRCIARRKVMARCPNSPHDWPYP